MPLQGQVVEEVGGLLGKTLSASLVLITHGALYKTTLSNNIAVAFNVDVQKGWRSQIPQPLGQEQCHGLISPQNACHLQPL